ncbi:hypothetical protein SAMN05444396_103154 [Flavobacterium segetis]|uniref:Uncharacterized protein n=1 Tax=Flavobacterium segetis TaxID=271157 RepID=A0A1M5FZ70_9FLAO|nr:hypothetical protein SAMN05444396_103154 [Flavobacterium segetis]
MAIYNNCLSSELYRAILYIYYLTLLTQSDFT